MSMSAIEPLDDRASSAVRFETQCVVIPDPEHRSRRPRVVTKSYALPLWKRRTSSAYPSLPEDNPSEEQSHLVLRVPFPTFTRKQHSMARSVDHTPLPPCLVHRASLAGPSCVVVPGSPARRSLTPRKPSPSPSRSDAITVPLRPCCAACQPVTEAATVGGDAWPEQFSRAASRRRSLSADGGLRTLTVAGSAASASYGNLGVSISVDEIDKRRRSSDTGPSTFTQEMLSNNAKAKGDCRIPLIPRFTSSATDARPPPSPIRLTPTTLGIPEEEDDEDEDENELFPLPSPKRTPSTSPTPSPAGSISSLMVTHTSPGSTVSPTPSTSSSSGHSAGPPPSKRDFLAPPPCASSSSLSLPKLSESTTDLTQVEDTLRAPSPSLLSSLPTLSARHHSRSPSPRISFIPPTPTDVSPTATHRPSPNLPAVASAVPSSPSPSQASDFPHHSPTRARFSWGSGRSASADMSPTRSPAPLSSCSPPSPTSPTLSTSTASTKRSFSMSMPRHIIADVLRGVGAMSVSGVAPGI